MMEYSRLLLVLLLTFPAVTRTAAAESEAPPEPGYPETLVETGREHFISNCGFCHGRDAQGGSQGQDLTRSELVANDEGGNLIGEVTRTGRPDKGMPSFPQLDAATLEAIAAYIHTQRYLALTAEGGRRSVEPEDLLVGDAEAGQRYFAEHCTSCHSAGGDLAGIGRREGLGLLMNMLYPRQAARSSATLTVTTDDGAEFSGTLAYRDEFTVAMTGPDGVYRSFATDRIEFSIEDPLDAHIEQLARYTDKDMHDVYAFLRSLR